MTALCVGDVPSVGGRLIANPKEKQDKLTTAALVAKFPGKAGIRFIFGYPGDPNLDLMEEARKEGIEFVLARREGTAAFMADAYGQLTGLPDVCLSTLGPGSTNLGQQGGSRLS